ncbi:PAS domain-containing sensor histidine kinase [Paraconexibacter algicola]|uniref:PAS domain-containing sensor histidine kinase n=1 Tax=Paraconexibacter algicola TaxID=2133960 RepID=UPI0018EE77BA|nr:PAS domain-containing sensor histidine kinase [Paraconexibacter algicola]
MAGATPEAPGVARSGTTAGRRAAIDRVEALGFSLTALHAALLVVGSAVPGWGWVLVAALVAVTAPSLAGAWIVDWPLRVVLLLACSTLVVLAGDEDAQAAWTWMTLAVAVPAFHGRPPLASLYVALITATTTTVLAAASAPWSVAAPAAAAVLLVGALATGLADGLRAAEGASAVLQSRERRFGALLRDAAEVIVLVGPDREVQFVSPALGRVLGHADTTGMGDDWLGLVHPDDRATVLQLARRVRAMPGTPVSAELRARHADGRHVWIHLRVVDLTANPDVGGIVLSFHDISDQKDAASEERLRISRDLHDSVSQALFSMTLQSRAAQLQLERAGLDPQSPARRTVTDVADLARGALAEIRALIFELRPRALVEEGFVSAVRKHAAAVGSRHRVAVVVEAPAERIPVGEAVEEHLFRVIQEAVGNAARHAHAERITVDIATAGEPPWVTVTVQDDGRGFDPAARFDGHFGLETMRERVAVLGGQLRIDSAPGAGTTVAVAIPAETGGALVTPARGSA